MQVYFERDVIREIKSNDIAKSKKVKTKKKNKKKNRGLICSW